MRIYPFFAGILISMGCALNGNSNGSPGADADTLKQIVLINAFDSLRYTGLPEVITGIAEIDSFFEHKAGVQTKIHIEKACDSCCKSYERLIDSVAGLTLYCTKENCTQRFENHQYLFENGRLAMARDCAFMLVERSTNSVSDWTKTTATWDFRNSKAQYKSMSKVFMSNDSIAAARPQSLSAVAARYYPDKTGLMLSVIRAFKENANVLPAGR